MRKLCQYRDIGGIPGKGIHKHRFMGLASFDLFATLFGCFLLYYIFQIIGNKTLKSIKLWVIIIIVFILGIFFHWLFCVPTTLNKWLGLTS